MACRQEAIFMIESGRLEKRSKANMGPRWYTEDMERFKMRRIETGNVAQMPQLPSLTTARRRVGSWSKR